MQERVHPEGQRHLEDFRQKRSMGLTLAESELTKLDAERDKDQVILEKERACAEQFIAKIEEVLLTAQAVEEEKEFHNAVCYSPVYEAFGSKSERTSKSGAQTGLDWIPSKNQAKYEER